MQFYLGAGMGFGVGLAQWIMLRRHFARLKNWIWSSALGMGIPFIAPDLVMTDTHAYKILIGIGLGGITTGVLQAAMLRKLFSKNIPLDDQLFHRLDTGCPGRTVG